MLENMDSKNFGCKTTPTEHFDIIDRFGTTENTPFTQAYSSTEFHI